MLQQKNFIFQKINYIRKLFKKSSVELSRLDFGWVVSDFDDLRFFGGNDREIDFGEDFFNSNGKILHQIFKILLNIIF